MVRPLSASEFTITMETHFWVCLHEYFHSGLSWEGGLTLNVGSPAQSAGV